MIVSPGQKNCAALLSMKGIDKSFPGVHALSEVDLELNAGEVLALLGENGAGKSTLMKILGGALAPDRGVIHINGDVAQITTPTDALRAGVAVIYQEFNLVPALTARENIFLGQEHATGGFIRRREERQEAEELFRRIGVVVDPDELCRNLSVAHQQVVEIAKALLLKAKILVMDEPSATLTVREVERLFDVIRDLRSQGIGIIYISHRLDEIEAIADRVTVLRDGENVGVRQVEQMSRDDLIELMVGRKLENEFPAREVVVGPSRLTVTNLCRGSVVKGVSFNARRGEVLAITGLVGAGRTETARLIFGADVRDAGSIELDGNSLQIRYPRDAIRAGICLLTEDRKNQGLVMVHSVCENFGLPNLPQFSTFGMLKRLEEHAAFESYVDRLSIKVSYSHQFAGHLSGGNQQKLVLAKWLQRNCEVIIFDEPTRGIDIGAKYEIYQLINQLAGKGKVIIIISSELPEVLGMADRILVMYEGRIAGEITDVTGATQTDVLRYAMG